MYPEYEITNDQVGLILGIEENYLNDVKSREIKPAKLSDTVSAFANAAGGDIYEVGIRALRAGSLQAPLTLRPRLRRGPAFGRLPHPSREMPRDFRLSKKFGVLFPFGRPLGEIPSCPNASFPCIT